MSDESAGGESCAVSEPGLGRAAARGAAITVGGQLARMGLQIVAVIVLSRLLAPSDFGVIALALLVIGFGELFRDFGLSQAAVQASTLSHDQRSNLFWVNTGIGVVLAVLCTVAGWPLAAISGEPQVTAICQVLASTFLINAMAAQYRAGLMRQLRFAALAALEVGAAAAGLAVAIAAAGVGFGYWALVAQQLTTVTITMLGMVLLGRWLPRPPNRDGDIRGFLRFGWNLVGSQIFTYASANIDTAIVGLTTSSSMLGLYNRAYQLIVVPVGQVRSPLTNVAVPVLSRLKDTVDAFDRFVLRAQLLLGYALCLPLSFVAIAAEPIVRIALGPEWAGSVFFLRCFAVAALFQTLAYVGFWIYLARGLPHILLRYSAVSAGIKIACVLTGMIWGPYGVAIGFAVAPTLSWPLSLWWLSRHTMIPVRGLYSGASRFLGAAFAGGLLALAVMILAPLPPVLLLVVSLTAYLVGVAAMLAIPVYRRDLAGVIDTVKLLRSRA